MRTNIVLDDKLVKKAMRYANRKTKREAVDVALREYVARRERPDIRELFGQDLIDPEYDYKALRSGRGR